MAYSRVRAYITAVMATEKAESAVSNDRNTEHIEPIYPEKQDNYPVFDSQKSPEYIDQIRLYHQRIGTFTGCDQPTKDEDHFLPSSLRRRRMHSDVGPVDMTSLLGREGRLLEPSFEVESSKVTTPVHQQIQINSDNLESECSHLIPIVSPSDRYLSGDIINICKIDFHCCYTCVHFLCNVYKRQKAYYGQLRLKSHD